MQENGSPVPCPAKKGEASAATATAADRVLCGRVIKKEEENPGGIEKLVGITPDAIVQALEETIVEVENLNEELRAYIEISKIHRETLLMVVDRTLQILEGELGKIGVVLRRAGEFFETP